MNNRRNEMNENLSEQFKTLLKADDVAERLNISRSLAYRLMQHGEINTIKINSLVRVSEVDLNRFIQKNRTKIT